ncbi:hypothetical protein [Paucilactobacillus hokkaidonensis]|uniref:hypothetical protein n=1 Tax=Paucilactobacillus hokkaidonensis TaxID=1193095 RepID=UPI000AAE1CEE|nr:hypothetical protein [Paucilactobacillus hokkaidonensis]
MGIRSRYIFKLHQYYGVGFGLVTGSLLLLLVGVDVAELLLAGASEDEELGAE